MIKQGEALATIEKTVSQDKIDEYAKATGDFNPIHIDQVFAKTTQFGSTIAHGLLVAAYISELMFTAFGTHWSKGGSMKIRFRAPVRPNDKIKVCAIVDAIEYIGEYEEITCSVNVSRQNGEIAISGRTKTIITN